MKECATCKTLIGDDALFCPMCGAKQEAEAEKQSPLGKKCVQCGEELEEDMDFCPFCGKKQNMEESDTSEKDDKQQPLDHQEPTNEENEEDNIPLTPDELEKVKLMKIIGVGLSACIVILPFIIRGGSFGIGWYALMAFSAMVGIAFTGKRETKGDKKALNFGLILLTIIAIIMYIWGPINPKYY